MLDEPSDRQSNKIPHKMSEYTSDTMANKMSDRLSV